MWKLYRPCDRDMPGYTNAVNEFACVCVQTSVQYYAELLELWLDMRTFCMNEYYYIFWGEVNKWMHFFDGTNDLMCSEMKSYKTQTTQCNSLFSLFRFWMLEDMLSCYTFFWKFFFVLSHSYLNIHTRLL